MFNQKKVILDEDKLYRRIHPEQYDRRSNRLSSAAFKDYEMSVDWSRYCKKAKDALKGRHEGYYVASVQAKIPRQIGQKVYHSPSRKNIAHSMIEGKKTRLVSKQLRQSFELESI